MVGAWIQSSTFILLEQRFTGLEGDRVHYNFVKVAEQLCKAILVLHQTGKQVSVLDFILKASFKSLKVQTLLLSLQPFSIKFKAQKLLISS